MGQTNTTKLEKSISDQMRAVKSAPVDTTASSFRETLARLEKHHTGVIHKGRVGTDAATGKSITMMIGGYGFKDPKSGKEKEYLLPTYDPDKGLLTDDQVRAKFRSEIESGKIKGFDSIEEAHANMREIRRRILRGKK